METVLKFFTIHQEYLLLILEKVAMSLAIVIVVALCSRLIKRGVYRGMLKISNNDEIVARLIANVMAYSLYVFAIVMVLSVFGINTSSLVALLGAAGIAIGLALKDTLSNIAAGIMLLFLKPMKKGEFIEFDKYSATVVDIGLFTSIFETADGVYISSPNSNIWGSTIKNFNRNAKRRLDVTIRIAYKDSIADGFTLLNDIADNTQYILAEPERQLLVHALADNSVNLQLRVWCPSEKYWDVYWDIQKRIKPKQDEMGLTIPFPQQDIYIKR